MEHIMITAKETIARKKPMTLFSAREVETLKTTSAFYIPGCGTGPIIIAV
jgi:hypothetical protein